MNPFPKYLNHHFVETGTCTERLFILLLQVLVPIFPKVHGIKSIPGMKVIALATTHQKKLLEIEKPDMIINDFNDLKDKSSMDDWNKYLTK